MAEKYAPEATVKDRRVQEMAYTSADITIKTVTETVSVQPEIALKDGSKVIAIIDTDTKLTEPSKDKLEDIELESRSIKDNELKSDNERAAAAILESIAKKQKEIKEKIERREKVRFSRSADMFSSIVLYNKPEVGSKAEAKIELYSALKEKHNDYLAARFSGNLLSFSDKLLKKDAVSDKELSLPVEKARKYSDL
jgi:hypothetical protein